MTIEEIQSRLDALSNAMLAKGKVEPDPYVRLSANCRPYLVAKWAKAPGAWSHDYEHFDSSAPLAAQFEQAKAWAAALPSREQVKVNRFMEALSEAIELGKQCDVDVDVVNPLLALMETISKNAIAHQPEAVS
jgi:hypothetical protein